MSALLEARKEIERLMDENEELRSWKEVCPVQPGDEPRIHSHLSDCLPITHPLADEDVYCSGPGCKEMLHAHNNECMQTWIEFSDRNLCTACAKLGTVLYG